VADKHRGLLELDDRRSVEVAAREAMRVARDEAS
jgi:hypothetical protein